MKPDSMMRDYGLSLRAYYTTIGFTSMVSRSLVCHPHEDSRPGYLTLLAGRSCSLPDLSLQGRRDSAAWPLHTFKDASSSHGSRGARSILLTYMHTPAYLISCSLTHYRLRSNAHDRRVIMRHRVITMNTLLGIYIR